jgi:periodic tryptophan protein 2
VQVVVAGSLDTFQVYVWAVRTARLLDALAGHEGPVVALAFSPAQPLLASASWDRTVRTWDVFRRGPGGRLCSQIFMMVWSTLLSIYHYLSFG